MNVAAVQFASGDIITRSATTKEPQVLILKRILRFDDRDG